MRELRSGYEWYWSTYQICHSGLGLSPMLLCDPEVQRGYTERSGSGSSCNRILLKPLQLPVLINAARYRELFRLLPGHTLCRL